MLFRDKAELRGALIFSFIVVFGVATVVGVICGLGVSVGFFSVSTVEAVFTSEVVSFLKKLAPIILAEPFFFLQELK